MVMVVEQTCDFLHKLLSQPVRLAREVLRQILDKLTKKGMQLENHHAPQICDTLSPQSVAKDFKIKQLRIT